MRKLTELTPEELKNLFHNNKHLQNVTMEAAQEDLSFYFEDVLKPFEKCTAWTIQSLITMIILT